MEQSVAMYNNIIINLFVDEQSQPYVSREQDNCRCGQQILFYYSRLRYHQILNNTPILLTTIITSIVEQEGRQCCFIGCKNISFHTDTENI